MSFNQQPKKNQHQVLDSSDSQSMVFNDSIVTDARQPQTFIDSQSQDVIRPKPRIAMSPQTQKNPSEAMHRFEE